MCVHPIPWKYEEATATVLILKFNNNNLCFFSLFVITVAMSTMLRLLSNVHCVDVSQNAVLPPRLTGIVPFDETPNQIREFHGTWKGLIVTTRVKSLYVSILVVVRSSS